MTIRTRALYDSKRAKHGADAADNKFTAVFMDALKSVKGDLEIRCGLEFDAPANIREDIDIDEKYYTVISMGLDFFICTHGEWLLDDSTTVERRYEQAKRTARMAAMKDAEVEGKLGILS